MLNALTENKTPAGTAYVDIGDGESLVLIHGVGLNKAVWQLQIDAFSDNYRVIAYDTLGHGHSRIPQADVALDDYFEQLVELLDSLEISRANLCGHSMGALITLGFSLSYPERIGRIIPMMGAYDRSPEHLQRSLKVVDMLAESGAAGLLDTTLERWFTERDYADSTRSNQISQVREWLQQADQQGYSRAYRVLAENGETYVGRLGEISAPALFFTADGDPNSTPEMSRRMAREVQQGQVYVMPGERHMGQFLGAASIEPLIRQFLETPLTEAYSNG